MIFKIEHLVVAYSQKMGEHEKIEEETRGKILYTNNNFDEISFALEQHYHHEKIIDHVGGLITGFKLHSIIQVTNKVGDLLIRVKT